MNFNDLTHTKIIFSTIQIFFYRQTRKLVQLTNTHTNIHIIASNNTKRRRKNMNIHSKTKIDKDSHHFIVDDLNTKNI